MVQSSSTEHNSGLATKPWWEPEPNTTAEPILKASEPRNGLASSRWAVTCDDGRPAPLFTGFTENVAPIERNHNTLGNLIVGSGFDLETEHGFPFNALRMSVGANAIHPGTYGSLIGGMQDNYDTPTTKISSKGFEGITQLPVASTSFNLEIEMDDDGDVVMMDLTDPNTIMLIDKVARAEREAGTTSEHADLKPELRPMVSSSRISNPSSVFVIDTNFILAHLELVNNLTLSHPRWRNVIVMPWATIQELDGLKKSTRQNEGIEVAKLARRAINWAYRAFERRDPGAWAQIKQEKCDNDASYGDSAILDCCVYFQMQGHPTVLLSHDKNLCLQAMSYNIRIVAMDGITNTAEDILSRFVINPPNPQVEPVQNKQPVVFSSSRSVNSTYTRTSRTPLPSMERIARTPTLFDTYKEAPTYSPISDYTPSIPGPSNTDGRKPQPPFCSAPSLDILYLQHGIESMEIGSPIPSGGLHDSVYAPRNKTPVPRSHKYAIPIAKPSFSLSGPSFPRNTTTRNEPGKSVVDIKLGLKGLLQNISSELVINIVPLLKKCTLEKLGGMETLQHLNIAPEKQVHSIFDMEKFFHAHWVTVFMEIFPDNLRQVFCNAELNHRYTKWIYWTEFSGPALAGPEKWEIRKWIEEWDLIWKRLIYTEREAMVNMNLVDEWRVALAKIGLSED